MPLKKDEENPERTRRQKKRKFLIQNLIFLTYLLQDLIVFMLSTDNVLIPPLHTLHIFRRMKIDPADFFKLAPEYEGRSSKFDDKGSKKRSKNISNNWPNLRNKCIWMRVSSFHENDNILLIFM